MQNKIFKKRPSRISAQRNLRKRLPFRTGKVHKFLNRSQFKKWRSTRQQKANDDPASKVSTS